MVYSMHHHHHHHHNKYPHIYFLSPDTEAEYGAFNTHISTSSDNTEAEYGAFGKENIQNKYVHDNLLSKNLTVFLR
jgi:hypothetical protein